jgi:hypothetical protein
VLISVGVAAAAANRRANSTTRACQSIFRIVLHTSTLRNECGSGPAGRFCNVINIKHTTVRVDATFPICKHIRDMCDRRLRTYSAAVRRRCAAHCRQQCTPCHPNDPRSTALCCRTIVARSHRCLLREYYDAHSGLPDKLSCSGATASVSLCARRSRGLRTLASSVCDKAGGADEPAASLSAPCEMPLSLLFCCCPIVAGKRLYTTVRVLLNRGIPEFVVCLLNLMIGRTAHAGCVCIRANLVQRHLHSCGCVAPPL